MPTTSQQVVRCCGKQYSSLLAQIQICGDEEMAKLSSLCTLFTDGDWIESKDQSDSGIRLIQTGNIGEGCFLEKEGKEKYISEDTFEVLKCEEVFPGDILISRLPAT